jgi:dGTPase
MEGQIARVADIAAYVNHDIDDAVRAGILNEADLPADAVAVIGRTSSQRINTMVTDVVTRTMEAGLTEVRMSDEVLQAT